jgi:hypothetical protein
LLPTDAASESCKQGLFFDIVKIGRKGNVDGEVLAVWFERTGQHDRSTVRFLQRYIPLPAGFGSPG